MKVTTLPADQLSQGKLNVWSQFQRANSDLDSPYFRREFTQVVAEVRNDVEVAVLKVAGELIRFFPYQRGRGGVARLVGGRLSDFQGIPICQNFALNADQLIKICQLKAWHFDHALTSQVPLRQVAVGSVDLRLLSAFASRQRHRAYVWAHRASLRRPARIPARALYRIREWFAFQ
jgi:hypothetical protein